MVFVARTPELSHPDVSRDSRWFGSIWLPSRAYRAEGNEQWSVQSPLLAQAVTRVRDFLTRPSKCVFKKNIILFPLFSRFGARFSAPFFPVWLGYVTSGVRAALRRRECLFPPCVVPHRVFAPQFCKGRELYHLRGLHIHTGGVQGRFSAQRGCGLPSPIRFGDSEFSTGWTTISKLSPHGPSSRTLHLALFRWFWGEGSATRQAILGQLPVAVRYQSGNFGASAHCHPPPVWQFRGKCPLPSATSLAISGQVPIAVNHSSGNFGASAHCHPSFVRQFRGKCQLPSVIHQVIPG